MKKEEIIIVGAGIAGLTLAKELAADHDVLIIEASDRAGGRIHSCHEEGFGSVIEAGAEFIHGHLEHTFALLKEAGIEYSPVEGEMYKKDKGEWTVISEMIEGWDELLKKMKELDGDMTLYEFLTAHFHDDKYADLRRHTISYSEGFDVADARKVSVKALYKEWSHEEQENFRIPAGYSALVNFMIGQCKEKGCHILFGEAVKQVDWKKNEVAVHTTARKRYNGTRAVITVPLSILQRSTSNFSINFTPALNAQLLAARQIGFGSVIKVNLLFKERFWKEDTGFILNDDIIPTWWTQLPNPVPLLTGWAGGPKAEMLGHDGDASLLRKAIYSLSNIFDIPEARLKANLQASKIFNWQRNEYALGGYSFARPETVAARELLNKPIEDTIFFSGEGLYDGHCPGTVEAAIIHAKETAAKIK